MQLNPIQIAPHVILQPTTRPRVLVVDDDPTFGKIMERAAAYLNADMVFVQSLQDLDPEKLGAFDVAIVDYDLGSVTGIELARYLDHHVSVPIILVSHTEQIPNRQWSDSIHDFVHKSAGAHVIMDAAFEAHEIACIHRDMKKRSTP